MANVSTATREYGSSLSNASSTASETWSASLSGCPSVTDSLVKRRLYGTLRSLAPRCDIFDLFRRHRVDLDAHRRQLETRNLFVDLDGNVVDLLLQRLVVRCEIN